MSGPAVASCPVWLQQHRLEHPGASTQNTVIALEEKILKLLQVKMEVPSRTRNLCFAF